MAQERLYSTREDVDWLFDVHLKDFPLWRERTRSFVLHGHHEDSPNKVELFDVTRPLITTKPFVVHAFTS